jgi:hypothetical protein
MWWRKQNLLDGQLWIYVCEWCEKNLAKLSKASFIKKCQSGPRIKTMIDIGHLGDKL